MGMLVLTRQIGERVVILLEDGRRIVVEQRGSGSMGFIADKSIKVLREELLEAARREGGGA
jgi:sRNA-binding carbon storage regulator CsrA